MRKYLVFLIILILILPGVSLAQNAGISPATGGIVPCDGATGTVCNLCHVVELGQNILLWLISIIAAIIALVFVIGGLKMVIYSTNESEITKAKNMMTNAIIGFIILLASWLIVDTILKVLITGDPTQEGATIINPEYGPWNQIECVAQPTYRETAPDEIPPDVVPVPEGETYSHNEAIAALASNVTLKSGASLEGVQQHVIAAANDLASKCGCAVVITEGTGGSHADGTYSHANGYKLDLRTFDNPTLLNYVQRLPPAGQWSDGTKLYSDQSSCATYAVEGDHIDVVYKPSC